MVMSPVPVCSPWMPCALRPAVSIVPAVSDPTSTSIFPAPSCLACTPGSLSTLVSMSTSTASISMSLVEVASSVHSILSPVPGALLQTGVRADAGLAPNVSMATRTRAIGAGRRGDAREDGHASSEATARNRSRIVFGPKLGCRCFIATIAATRASGVRCGCVWGRRARSARPAHPVRVIPRQPLVPCQAADPIPAHKAPFGYAPVK